MAPRKVTLSNLGDLEAIVDREFGKICENIADPNIKADAVREMTVKIKVKPDKKKNIATLSYHVQTKCPGVEPNTASVFIAMDKGELALYNMDIRQGELPLAGVEPFTTEIRSVSDAPKSVAAPQPTFVQPAKN